MRVVAGAPESLSGDLWRVGLPIVLADAPACVTYCWQAPSSTIGAALLAGQFIAGMLTLVFAWIPGIINALCAQ